MALLLRVGDCNLCCLAMLLIMTLALLNWWETSQKHRTDSLDKSFGGSAESIFTINISYLFSEFIWSHTQRGMHWFECMHAPNPTPQQQLLNEPCHVYLKYPCYVLWVIQAIAVKVNSVLLPLVWSVSPAFSLRQRNELSGLEQKAQLFVNFIKGCCWFTALLLCTAVASQRPEHSVSYKQKEFLRAAKVVIKCWLYYSGIRSD